MPPRPRDDPEAELFLAASPNPADFMPLAERGVGVINLCHYDAQPLTFLHTCLRFSSDRKVFPAAVAARRRQI